MDLLLEDLPPVMSALREDVQNDVGDEQDTENESDLKYDTPTSDNLTYDYDYRVELNYTDIDNLNDTLVNDIDTGMNETSYQSESARSEDIKENATRTEKTPPYPNVRPMSTNIEILPNVKTSWSPNNHFLPRARKHYNHNQKQHSTYAYDQSNTVGHNHGQYQGQVMGNGLRQTYGHIHNHGKQPGGHGLNHGQRYEVQGRRSFQSPSRPHQASLLPGGLCSSCARRAQNSRMSQVPVVGMDLSEYTNYYPKPVLETPTPEHRHDNAGAGGYHGLGGAGGGYHGLVGAA
eukprot:TRINITY_DN15341_c0_g1_i1.p1 TRINITY_DN15341_c0_g1~~TRINITY_DN15341_c0_g1_i1.p1  ORF type:complete len:319 (+),score=82.86 TRINITY_DN15341_c0_g1_i1:90-959(+)